MDIDDFAEAIMLEFEQRGFFDNVSDETKAEIKERIDDLLEDMIG